MSIKSNQGIVGQKSQQLTALCNGIGNTNVECGGGTNLSGVGVVTSSFATNNAIYKSYKQVVDADASNIANIGAAFRTFDETMMRRF